MLTIAALALVAGAVTTTPGAPEDPGRGGFTAEARPDEIARLLGLERGAGDPAEVLAPLFDRPREEGRYPRLVWAWLDGCPPGEAFSRRERLIAQWVKPGLIPGAFIDEGGSPEARRRIRALTSPLPDQGALDADLLRDRGLMLGDVRAQVEAMKPGLAALLSPARAEAALP